MARSPEWIMSQYKARQTDLGPLRARAAQISETYDGVVSVPLPELDQEQNAAVANWLTLGLDQLANRISSVTPSVMCPPVISGQTRSEDNARRRRLATGWWWQENRIPRKIKKRSRWYIGYASTPVVIRPDPVKGIPVWEIRDPLCSYPAPMPEADDLTPTDCIFDLRRSWGWINERWPAQARMLNMASHPDPDEQYQILEYLDGDEGVMIAVGKPPAPTRSPYGGRASAPQGVPFIELVRYENRVGRCPVVNPTRLSLNHARGQFDQMPALYKMQARAMALWLIATERSIFPDTWFVSRPNELVQVVRTPDGRAGIPGEVKGGDLKEVSIGPPPQVGQVIELLGDNQKMTAGIASDFGGEAPTNTRTGRAAEQLLHNTVDFWMQDAQEALAASMEEENRLAYATAKAYFGSSPKQSQHVYWKWAKGPVSYVPNDNFDSDVNQVAWPYAGSDANQVTIRGGQMLGLKAMSVRTFQELSPDIDDPDLEHDRIMGESLEQALLASIDQSVAGGQLGPLEVSRLTTLVREHKLGLADAFQKIHEETQDLQAQAAAGGGQPGTPGAGPDGNASTAPSGPPGPPGLMAPGIQQQLGIGPMNPPGGGVPTPSPGVAHMSQLLGDLRARK